MARFMSSSWICVLFMMLVMLQLCSAQAIGVNWGTSTRRPLLMKSMIQLLKDNNITKVKLDDADKKLLNALGSTSCEVMISAPNFMLQSLQNIHHARAWVKYNVSYYIQKKHVNIAYIAIGNNPFLGTYYDEYVGYILPAMNNVHQALQEAKLQGVVKLVVPIAVDVLSTKTHLPSQTLFKKEYSEVMTNIVSNLTQYGSPFMVNLNPYLSLVKNRHVPKNFAFFNSNSSVAFIDGAYTYTNALEASIDSVANALASVGAPASMPIVLGEIGWPTDGDLHATLINAQKFNQGFLNFSFQMKGTPRQPNTSFDFYLLELFDEDAKDTLLGNFERHWGIFDYAGQAKYSLDLSGQGLNIPLVHARVKYMDKKWCVLNKDEPFNKSHVEHIIHYACHHGGDCTSFEHGGSCNKTIGMGMHKEASYALNSYYQAHGQKHSTCNFHGLAIVIKKDPSLTYGCNFPVAVCTSTNCSRAWNSSVFMNALMSICMALVTLYYMLYN